MIPKLFTTTCYLIIASFLLTSCKAKDGESSEEEKAPVVSAPSAMSSDFESEQSIRDAALDGQLELVKQLIKKKVNLNAIDQDGRTALMLAGYNGHTEIVRLLLDGGARVNIRDGSGRTALLFASTGPFPKTVELLLERKADPNIVDNQERFSALMHAAAEGHIEVVKTLLDYEADATLKDIDGDTAESFARQNGHNELADLLKER